MEDLKLDDVLYSRFGRKVIAAFNSDSKVLSSIQKLEKVIEDYEEGNPLVKLKNRTLELAYWGIFFQAYLNGNKECITKLKSYVNNLEKEVSHNENLDLAFRLGTFYEEVFKS